MKTTAIAWMCWLGLATTVAAQAAATSPGQGPKMELKQVRTLLHELQARSDKLHELMEQYRSMVAERPQGSAEQLAKWNASLDRLLQRIEGARAAVAETEQRLDPSATGQLPTNLAKEVVTAHNEAEAERTSAEHALKSKPATARAAKQGKQAPAAAKPAPPLPSDLDL
jgi:hypothetical protein